MDVVVVVLLIPVALYFWRSLSDFPLWQRRISLVVRSFIVVLLVLALAGLAWLSPTQRMFVVMAIDRSESVDADAKNRIDEVIAQTQAAQGEHQLAFVDFASEPGSVTADLAARQDLPKSSCAAPTWLLPSKRRRLRSCRAMYRISLC